MLTFTNQLVSVPDWNDSATADKIAEIYSKIKLLLSNKIKPITLKTELRRILFFAPILSVIAPQGSSVIKEINQKIDKYKPTSAKEKFFDNKKIYKQLEVDFVINKGHQRYYIQSALNVDSTEKKEQETVSLKKIDDSFKKIVIVRKRIIPKHDNDGILYIGVEDFLLNETIIDL